MNDSQRIDALKLIITQLIDILGASDTEAKDGHFHEMFNNYDAIQLEELRAEVGKI